MKIERVSVDVVRRETPSLAVNDRRGAMGGVVDHGVLRVFAEDGIEGNCLFGVTRIGAQDLPQLIANTIAPWIVGRDVSDREWLWTKVSRHPDWGAALSAAWSSVDVALWDIAGKAAEMPVHALLGSCRGNIPVYATFPPRHTTQDGYMTEAKEVLARGFPAYKIHPGIMPAKDVTRMVGMVRRLVGDDVALMLDPNSGYDLASALEIGRALDDNGFEWFEDPVRWDDFESIATLSQSLKTPLATSDAGPFLFREVAARVLAGAPRILRGSARKLGITGLKKECSLLEGFGMRCEIGTGLSPSMNAANLHVSASVSNCAYYEWWMPTEFQYFGVRSMSTLSAGGILDVPDAPGLGIELDEDWIAAHRIATVVNEAEADTSPIR